MKVSIVPFESKYAEHFYLLNYDWLDEYFYVEPYDEQVLKNCKEEIIDKEAIAKMEKQRKEELKIIVNKS